MQREEEGKRRKCCGPTRRVRPKPLPPPHLCSNLTWMLFKGGRNEQVEETNTETGKLLNTRQKKKLQTRVLLAFEDNVNRQKMTFRSRK